MFPENKMRFYRSCLRGRVQEKEIQTGTPGAADLRGEVEPLRVARGLRVVRELQLVPGPRALHEDGFRLSKT